MNAPGAVVPVKRDRPRARAAAADSSSKASRGGQVSKSVVPSARCSHCLNPQHLGMAKSGCAVAAGGGTMI